MYVIAFISFCFTRNMIYLLYIIFACLFTDKIAASIAQEVKRMQRRRQLQFPSASQSGTLPAAPERTDDIASCPSTSSPDQSPQMSQSLSSLLSCVPQAKKDAPLFTFRQVSLICERLVREREEEVREQYDKVLNCKLAGNILVT